MFVINKTFLEPQFSCFKKEGGLLPSFSIRLINQPFDRFIESTYTIGDFTFYKPQKEGFYFSTNDTFLWLNSDFNEAKLLKRDKSVFDPRICSNLLMLAYIYRLIDYDSFMIHAAAVVYEKQGILFCGMSGAGKSTQANLWKKYLNTNILNYDKPCIIKKNDMLYVHGSPWSGKEALFLNEYVPLQAIVFVKQSKENKVVKLSYGEAYSEVYLHNYVYPLTSDIDDKYSDIIKNTISKIPIFKLFCDISENSVEMLYNELFNNKPYSQAKKEHSMKYKVKDCFQMRQIADDYIVVPRGNEAIQYSATLVFNDSGAFLWNKLSEYIDMDDLADCLAKEYNLEITDAMSDVVSFIDKLNSNGLIEHI